MRGFGKTLLMVMALAMVTSVAACQNSEEQAEEHFQNAMAFLAEGDTARASVEFRNVFQNNGQHREARQNFAAMLRETGEIEQSYSQYLRLVEQYPDDIPARIALAEMAISFQSWEEAERHGRRAIDLAPDDPAVSVISVYLDYVAAVDDEDAVARRAAFDTASDLRSADPENTLLRLLVIDNALRQGEYEAALELVHEGLAESPADRDLNNAKLGLLAQLERYEDVEAQLRSMIALFPEDEELPGTLLRFYISQEDLDAAEGFLREVAETAEDPDRRNEALAALVQMRLELGGPTEALEELDRIIAEERERATEGDRETVDEFRALRAALRYADGDRDAAIAELEGLLGEEISLTLRGQVQVSMAQMLLSEGNSVGARRLVEEALESDPSQVEALRMMAAWMIEEDQADRAIAQLRTALDARPDDPDALTLMALAHSRNGNGALAREFLSLAVEASNAAPGPSMRYAQALVDDGRLIPAEEVLIGALRLAPNNQQLLVMLGSVYLELEDWPRATQVEQTLRRIGGEEGLPVADQLRTAILTAQGRTDEALAFLEELAGEGENANVAAQIAVVQAHLSAGDTAGAVEYASALLADDPENPVLRFTLAAAQTAARADEAATELYRGLTADFPESQQAWMGLIRSLSAQDEDAAARDVLEEALLALPDAPDLLWAQASYLERAGDIEGAIALYERLYEMVPNALIVANNLASLMSAYRDDDESLERAYTIARRLRGSDVAPFQDTFGWIAHRRGEFDAAIEHLEPAAAALSGDPLVQYHLGMAYLAVGRSVEALDQLRRAVEIAGPDDGRPQFATARTQIAALEAAEQEAAAAEDETEAEPAQ